MSRPVWSKRPSREAFQRYVHWHCAPTSPDGGRLVQTRVHATHCFMNGSLFYYRLPYWAAFSLAALAIALTVAVSLAAAINAGYFRDAIVRALAARSGRQIEVRGAWQVHLFSLHPRVIAERVTIGNPSWTPPGRTAQIGKVSLVFQIAGLHQSFGVDRLELENANLHLVRDAMGHANWQLIDPGKGSGNGLPLIRSLKMLNAQVELDDARRHLQFSGTASVSEGADPQGAQALRIDGNGQLNGKPDIFSIAGEPLAGVSHDRPYHFSFIERSSGTRLSGRGMLLRPFKFDSIDTSFDAVGQDLKDLYFLTGVTLVNTGSYRLSGKLALRGKICTFSDLFATSGQSDMHGRVSIDTTSGRPQLAVVLDSRFLRLSDLGARAAGREPQTSVSHVLSTAMVSPVAMRRSDAVVNFRAESVEVAHVPLQKVSATVTIDRGIATLAPLLADVSEGRLSAHVRLDASKDEPPVAADISVSGLQIGRLFHTASANPPFEGLLQARIKVTGVGRSIHQVAASASGVVTVVLPRGTVRASLAELAGLDLRGLGLLAAKSTQDTSIRCAVASFHAQKGILGVQNLTVDTEPVLVNGAGTIDLDTESLDLTFWGHPKKLRLMRLRSALFVRGTLARPKVDIQAAHAMAQMAEAAAAGVVLTPLASVLAFVDPGLTKDADCESLLSATKAIRH
jgi:uncharacterized protein involved in outer membrane biogenesis